MVRVRRSKLWGSIPPILLFAALACPSLVCGEDLFRRGDANADGYFDISDAVHISRWVFLGEPETPPICYYFNLADVNNDSRIDITDPIYLFLYLFSGGPEPSAPFPDCGPHPWGPDPTCDYPDCNAPTPLVADSNFVLDIIPESEEISGEPNAYVRFNATVRLITAESPVQAWSISIAASGDADFSIVAASSAEFPEPSSPIEMTELITGRGADQGVVSAVIPGLVSGFQLDPCDAPVDLLHLTIEAVVPEHGDLSVTLNFIDDLQGPGQPVQNRLTVNRNSILPKFGGCEVTISAQGKYGGGMGEPNDPYQIWDANDMQAIGTDANDWDKHFVLMADIDLSAYTGEEFNIIGYASTNPWDGQLFYGVFDGNDYTISNFTYVSDDRSFVGLFGVVGGEIKNLGLIDAEVDPGRGIVRRRGEVTGSLTGFLIDEGIIINCYAEGGSVTGDVGVGGLVGASLGTMTNCYATGSVRCSAENDDHDGDDVGGLVGWNAGAITNCYSTGNVTGSDDDYHVGYDVGGLVGWNGDAITNCYATGSVTGDMDVGGLVGYNRGQISNCYWDTETSGMTEPGEGEGLSTHQLHKQSTFTDWDFISVWNIGENQTYPYLRTHSPGDINRDGIANMIDFSIFGDYWLQPLLHAYEIDVRLRLVCANNLRALFRALVIYANDHDDESPTADQWCDLLLQGDYVAERLFVCPSAEPGRSHYAINPNSMGSISPPDMVLLFETRAGWNQFGGPELLAPENHQGKGCHILFHNGHVEFVQNERLGELRWERK